MFTHNPPSPWHDKENCVPFPPLFPPLSPTPFWTHRDLNVGSLWRTQYRGYGYKNWYWTVMVIAFCFYQFLIGRLWAEILAAIVWQKSVKSRRASIFCRRRYLLSFLHGGPVQISRNSAGESPPIKTGRPAATAHLVTACGEYNISGRSKKRTSARSRRS